MKRSYWQVLSDHPGIGAAVFMQIAGAIAGASNESFDLLSGAIFGGSIGSFMWVLVLLTAYQEYRRQVKP